MRKLRLLVALVIFWIRYWLERRPDFPRKAAARSKTQFARHMRRREAAVKVAQAAGISFWHQRWSVDQPLLDPTKGTT